jgi:hypothetical protein
MAHSDSFSAICAELSLIPDNKYQHKLTNNRLDLASVMMQITLDCGVTKDTIDEIADIMVCKSSLIMSQSYLRI